MRYSRQEDLLKLALMMQGSAEGISIADIERALFAQITEEGRGTAADRLAEAERGRARAVRRERIWMGTTAAAAVVADRLRAAMPPDR